MSSLLSRTLSLVLAAAAVATTGLAQAADAPAPPRLYADSTLVVRDRFSDEIIGSGPDLVFIPGLASSRETWKATADRLKGRYRLHLIQIAGFAGEAARANADGPVLTPTAEAIDAYLVEAKLTPATVIGHSLGGTTGLYISERHPDDIRRLLIVDALPFFGALFAGPTATPDKIRPMVEQMKAGMMAGGASAEAATRAQIAGMVTGVADTERVIGWGKASDHKVVAQAFADDALLDMRADLPRAKARIVVIYPDNVANGAPVGMMEKIYTTVFADLPDKGFVRADASKHFIMFDQPKLFADALDRFLAP